jgi:capsular exopolysaccharide synthesis family protein
MALDSKQTLMVPVNGWQAMIEASPPPVVVSSPGPPPGPPAETGSSATPDLSALLHSFRRRWFAALGAGLLLALAGAAAVLYIVPARYTSEARVHMASGKQWSPLGSNQEEHEHLNYVKSQKALVKSLMVLHAALQKTEVVDLKTVREQGHAALWLDKAAKVDTDLGPETMRITLEGDYPDELPIILNALVHAYLDKVEEGEKSKRQATIDTLLKNHRKEVHDLTAKRSELARKREAAGIEDPATSKSRIEQAVLQRANTETARLQMELKRKQAEHELKGLQDQERMPQLLFVSEADIERLLRQDPAIKQNEEALAKLEQEIQKIEVVVADEFKKQALESPLAQRAKIRVAIENAKKAQRPAIQKELRESALAKLQDDIVKKRNEVNFCKDGEKTLGEALRQKDAEIDRLRGGNRVADKGTGEIEELQDEVEQRENALKRIGEQLKVLQVDPPGGTRVSLQEAATVPETRNTDRQLKYAGIAAFGLFGLGLVSVSWRDVRARRIYRTEEVVKGLGLGLIGTLPALPNSARRSLAGGADTQDVFWQSLLAESVDAIRTVLLHSGRNESLRTVMITSAVSGEGKTSLATHLAASLARSWRRTLLVDCDLRNPAAHRQFNVPLEPGFSEVLRGEAEIDEVVRPTAVSRLWVVPAGHWDAHAIQALAQENVRALFEQLKEQYDFIVIDSSPVLPVADALLIGQNVDGVLFSILRDVTRAPLVQSAYQRLAALGIRLLGAVVIGEPTDVRALGYHAAKHAGG